MDRQGLQDLLDESLPYDYLTMSFAAREIVVRKMLRCMGLRVHRAAADESFVIGDSPVLAIRNTGTGEASLLHPGSQVVLPISSKCVLVYDWATPLNLIDVGPMLDREQVRSLNRDYYQRSNSRYIYGSTCDSLKRSQQVQRLWLPGKRSEEVSDGWWVMQQELQEFQRENVACRRGDPERLRLRGS